jgi:hypothetical protein
MRLIAPHWQDVCEIQLEQDAVPTREPRKADSIHLPGAANRDCDLTAGKISINKAVVYRRHKNRTKTGVDREITLCGRALDV